MKNIVFILTIVLSFAACKENPSLTKNGIEREDYFVNSTDSVDIFVREFKSSIIDSLHQYPLLLLHGGGPGVLASFDIDVPNGSFAEDLVNKGLKVYMMDIRGWERSTLPNYDESDSTLVIGNHKEAYDDIKNVVEFIKNKEGVEKISLFGWATGGHWGGYYASKNSEDLAHFISLNSLYGVNAPWELRHFFWKENDTTKYNRTGLYRISNKGSLARKWTSSIPIQDKNDWRDSLVVESYKNTAVSFGEDSSTMKVPGGYREESFYMSLGKKYWDASDITAPTLIIRTELDFWSRPEDLTAIENDLLNARRKRIVEIPGTHYVFLDRAERGKNRLIEEIVNFTKSR